MTRLRKTSIRCDKFIRVVQTVNVSDTEEERVDSPKDEKAKYVMVELLDSSMEEDKIKCETTSADNLPSEEARQEPAAAPELNDISQACSDDFFGGTPASYMDHSSLDPGENGAATQDEIPAVSNPPASPIEESLAGDLQPEDSEAASKLSCKFCDRTFTRLIALKLHYRTVHKDQGDIFNCSVSLNDFLTKEHQESHENLHPNDKTASMEFEADQQNMEQPCSFCEKTFKETSELNNHCNDFHSRMIFPFSCAYCSFVDKTFDGVSQHLLEKHRHLSKSENIISVPDEKSSEGDSNQRVAAFVKAFPSSANTKELTRLIKLELLIKGRKRLGGRKIDKTLVKSADATMIQEDDETRRKSKRKLVPRCDVFCSPAAKKMRVAFDQPFVCDICEDGFGSIKGLQAHTKFFHNDETLPVHCIYCRNQFADEQELAEHVRIHVIDKTASSAFEFGYEHQKRTCSNCEEEFRELAALLTHYKHCHETQDMPFKCSKCEFHGETQRMVEKHIKEHPVVPKEKIIVIKVL
jgi:hypothetical protein